MIRIWNTEKSPQTNQYALGLLYLQPPLSSSPQFLLLIILLHCAGRWASSLWFLPNGDMKSLSLCASYCFICWHKYKRLLLRFSFLHRNYCKQPQLIPLFLEEYDQIQNLHSNDTGHYNTQMMPQLSNVSKLVRVVSVLLIETPIFQGRFLILYALP